MNGVVLLGLPVNPWGRATNLFFPLRNTHLRNYQLVGCSFLPIIDLSELSFVGLHLVLSGVRGFGSDDWELAELL